MMTMREKVISELLDDEQIEIEKSTQDKEWNEIVDLLEKFMKKYLNPTQYILANKKGVRVLDELEFRAFRKEQR